MMTRRDMMAAAGAVSAATFSRTALGAWEPHERYPDPAIQILDPSFAKYRIAQTTVERLVGGMRWCEGPVYFGDARCLLWSDIPNNRIMRWDEETGRASVYRKPSNFANGNTRDRQGRLVTCEHDTRRLTRTEYDGTVTVLIDKFDGKPLNSPNDVVVKSDDSIWFTDPPFGILGNYEGHVATSELPTNVYRLEPKSGRASVVAGDINRPNGLCFSPDESKMYIVEAGLNPRVIRVYDITGDKLANGPHLRYGRARRDARRLPLRRRWQSVVRMGNGQRAAGRRQNFRSERQADRFHRTTGALRQFVLRGHQAQPPVHGGEPFGLFALCEHAGRAGRMTNRPGWNRSRRRNGFYSDCIAALISARKVSIETSPRAVSTCQNAQPLQASSPCASAPMR
jgi:gluconolactonase